MPSRHRARAFVVKWYRSIEHHEKGAGPEAEDAAEDKADDLMRRLAARPALRDLTINPLLLDMIVNVHCFRSKGCVRGGV